MKNIIAKIEAWHLERFVLQAILLLAIAIRFTGLVRRDFWYDEAFTGVAVKESFSNMLNMIINDVHPPLYYLVLKIFAYFFNYSVFGIRLFSAIFGVLAVWAIYLVAKEMFGRKAALWASFVTTVSPFAIQYSQEARMYSMLVFLILMATYFFMRALRTGERKFFLLWGLFMGLSMMTHYMGIIFSVTYFAAYLIWAYFENRHHYEGKKIKQKIGYLWQNILPNKNVFLGYVTALVVFAPWIQNFKHHLEIKGNLTWVKPASLGDIITTMQMFLFGTPLGEMSSGMPQPNEIGYFSQDGIKHMIAHISIRMVLAVLLGITLIWLWRKVEKKKLLMLIIFSGGFMFVVYMLSLLSTPQDPNEYFVARYLLPGAYFFFIYIGVVLANVKLPAKLLAFAIYFFMLSFIIPLTNSQGYNELIDHLDKYKKSDFYILNSFDYVITKYYLGADRLTLFNYDWPEYDPSYWAAIGPTLKRTENYQDLRNDPNAIIISNHPLNRDNQYFSTQGLVLVDQYKNILLYKFQN
ncbi:MAG TPA: glycosyltransferase family 39 protein [Patescibacteria group bacterium]